MFLLQAPQVRETEVFTRLPDRFCRTGMRSDWADANRGGQPTGSFLEGPVFDAAGNLYVTDIPFGRVFRIDPKGEWDLVAQWDGEPNGAKFLSQPMPDEPTPKNARGDDGQQPKRQALVPASVAAFITSGLVSWATTPDGNLLVTTVPGLVVGLLVYGLALWRLRRARSG